MLRLWGCLATPPGPRTSPRAGPRFACAAAEPVIRRASAPQTRLAVIANQSLQRGTGLIQLL